MSFLMGLNETYTTVRGQILLMNPIPSLGKVFSLLIQDEKQRKVGKKNSIESSTLAVKANGSSKSFNKAKSGRSQCTVVFWAMLLTSATSFTGTPLVISSRIRVHKLLLLLIML